MKDYKEVAKCVFERSLAIKEQKKQNKRAMICKIAVICPCVAVVLIFSVMLSSPFLKTVSNNGLPSDLGGNVNAGNTSKVEDVNDTPNNIGEEPPDNNNFGPNTDNAFIEWNGKRILSSLAEILMNADKKDVIKIYMQCSIDHSYKYNGKALSEYFYEKQELIILSDKLKTLVKVGDSLKYGEALYTTGTPSGERWTKEHYDEVVAFYGNDILAKYIVGGEFLKSTLSEDSELLQTNIKDIEKEYEKACKAYVRYAINNAKEQLILQNIQPTISSTGDCLILDISVEAFENLRLDNLSVWTFSSSSGGYGDLNDDIQMPGDTVIE